MAQVFEKFVLEFREACNLIFGFTIERLNIAGLGDAYRLHSLYAERAEDYLLFRVRASCLPHHVTCIAVAGC